MRKTKMRFVLASASPRRRELLESMGLKFDIIVADADEDSISPSGIPVGIYVQELALLKAAATAKRIIRDKRAIIIAADTVVALDGKVLGKPKDRQDAFFMLKSLSNREHEVHTGICVMRISDGKTYCTSQSTKVFFKELSGEMIASYIATNEPMDKAGAYGIQGKGAILVSKIEGDYNNVVGLGTSLLCDILKNEFNYDLLKQ